MAFGQDLSPTTPATPAQAAAWYDVMGKFQAAEQQFLAAIADLGNMSDFVSSQSADVQAQYNSLVARASTLNDTINSVASALADVKNALAGAWNAVTGVWSSVSDSVSAAFAPDTSSGMSPIASGYLLQGMGVLGVLPLIPIAIVAAAVAALGYFLSDYAQFAQKVALLKQYTAAGMTPQAAAAAVATATGSSSTVTGTMQLALWIGGGIALLWFLSKFMKGRA